MCTPSQWKKIFIAGLMQSPSPVLIVAILDESTQAKRNPVGDRVFVYLERKLRVEGVEWVGARPAPTGLAQGAADEPRHN